jgi:ribosomal protein L37AE/L43A
MILECKNFYGTLFFEKEFKQLIRSVNGQEEGFSDPITQARWHRTQLTNWLNINGFSSIPIEFLVMINDPSTIVKTEINHKDAKKYVTHNYTFLDRFTLINQSFKNEIFDRKLIKRLTKKLTSQHVEEDPDLLRRFRINEDEIIKGVQCPSCLSFGMKRLHGNWVCHECKISCKDAHLQTLSDYFLLINSSITNKQFRDFLLLSDPNTATYLLKNLDLSHSGSKRGRIYYGPLQK